MSDGHMTDRETAVRQQALSPSLPPHVGNDDRRSRRSGGGPAAIEKEARGPVTEERAYKTTEKREEEDVHLGVPQIIVRSVEQILQRAQVAHGGLDRLVAEHDLDLLERDLLRPHSARAGPAQVMRPDAGEADL
jgi:hypothetical protein